MYSKDPQHMVGTETLLIGEDLKRDLTTRINLDLGLGVHVTAVSNKTVKQTNHRAATLTNILGLPKHVSCRETRFKFES